jgi:hypothetical protein
MTAKEHSKTIGILFLIYGGLQLFGLVIAAIFFLFAGGVALAGANSREAAPIAVVFGFLIVILLISGLIVIPTLLAGWKLFKQKTTGKIWAIIAAILALFSFPLGTALGIYALWFVFGDEGNRFYNQSGMTGGYNPPPPPNNWR